MAKIKVLIGDTELQLPGCYEDCEDDLKLKLVRLQAVFANPFTDSRIGLYAIWIEVIRLLCEDALKMSEWRFKKWWDELSLDAYQLECLIEVLEWVKDRPEGRPIDSFEFEGVRYYLPEERFKYTSAAEWTEGLLDFMELGKQEENREERLDMLVANFCRPKRQDLEDWQKSDAYTGDDRVLYNRARAEVLAKDFARLDGTVKVLFLWWYEELINGFFEEYEDLFTHKGEKKEPRYADGRGFVMVLKNVAKGHYLGDFEKVQNTDVNVVYSLILDDFYDNKELEK